MPCVANPCPPARMVRSSQATLSRQGPRSLPGLQSQAAAAGKPVHQRPPPKPLLTLQMLQTSRPRNLQSQSKRRENPEDRRKSLHGSRQAEATVAHLLAHLVAHPPNSGGDTVPSALHTLVRISTRLHASCPTREPGCQDGPSWWRSRAEVGEAVSHVPTGVTRST
uniref:Uncharacterized protein n=1 Tax=Myotis myotis TaxID=51298 RepID=A0A7J7U5H9_MYOMY|nr:hypothetical protein mMyoMyo1_008897 [Myotis myotis]